jgi:putative spermidine/putrescine transport system substrate-binding protein
MNAARFCTVLFLILAAGSAASQAPSEPRIQGRLVVGIFGGLVGQELREVIDGYTKPLGVEAVYVEGTANDLLAKARAQKGNPQMDVFVGNNQTFALAKSLDLIEKLDPLLVPNLARIRPEFRDPDGFGQFFELNPVGLVYRTDKFAEARIAKPTSWLAYTEPALKGRGIIYPPTVSYGYHLLIGLAMGGGKDERDIALAWPKLDQIIANKAIISPTPGQAETMAARGEAWMYVSPALRAKLARDQGTPIGFVIPREGAIVFPDFMAPVKGAKNPVAAQRVINHIISKEIQFKRARDVAVAPVNMDVELTPEVKELLGFDPHKPLPALHVLDVDAINRQLDQWVERFNRATTR